MAHCEFGVISDHCASANNNGVTLGAQLVHTYASLFTSNPSRTIRNCGTSIKCGCHLQHHKRAACTAMMQIRRKLGGYFIGQHISNDFNTGCTQCIKPSTCNMRIRICNSSNNARYASRNNCFGTRTCSTSVRARFQCGIQRCATNITAAIAGSIHCNNFSVRSARWRSCTFVHRTINTHNNCTNPWVRSRVSTRGCSHMHGTTHERLVIGHVVSLLPSGLLPSASESH